MIFLIYKWNFWLDIVNDTRGIFRKIGALLLIITIGTVTALVTLGLLAFASWDYVNNNVAEKNEKKILELPVARFMKQRRKTSAKVEFWYQNRSESIKIDNNTYKDYENENPSDYQIVLVVQEGVWNYYVVRDWELRKKLE